MKPFKNYKKAPKTPGIAGESFWTTKTMGSRATARNFKNPRDLECLLPLCLPTPAVSVTVTAKNP